MSGVRQPLSLAIYVGLDVFGCSRGVYFPSHLRTELPRKPTAKLDPDAAPADDLRADIGRTIAAAIRVIRDSVSKGERVSLVGFGTFERKRRNGRIRPNVEDIPER